MKRFLALFLVLLAADAAYADSCAKSLTGMFTSYQAVKLCSTTLGTPTNPTVAGNLTFSSASAKILPGATSLLIRNNADAATNVSILDNGTVTLINDLVDSTAAKGVVLGEAARAATVTTVTTLAAPLYDAATASGTDLAAFVGFGAAANGPVIDLLKTRAVSGAATTIVSSGDTLGRFNFYGANGTTYDPAAAIIATSDATPGAATDMPGAIDFQTTPDGSVTLASVLKLKNDKTAVFGGDIIQSAAAKGLVFGEATRAANVTTATTLAAPIYDSAAASGTDLAAFVGFGASTSGPTIDLFKTRAVSGAATTIVSSGDTLGTLKFFGANGTTYDPAAAIVVKSDGTPGGATDMPGSIDLQTTPDGSVTLTSALKLNSAQRATFGGQMTSVTGQQEVVAGAGTTQANAGTLSSVKNFHQITGANGTVGWTFGTALVAGDFHFLLSTTAGVPLIYAPTGGTCNGGGANAACTLLSGIVVHVCYATSTSALICG